MDGSRVLYRPVTMRRGIKQRPTPATVISIYPDTDQILIKCDGERIQRRVKIKHTEVING